MDGYDMSSSNTSSEETFSKIRAWLKNCEIHEAGRGRRSITRNGSVAPTRLLEIGTGRNRPTVRVISGQYAKSCCYATLSHCWGGGSPTMLLSDNFDIFHHNIPWDVLPLTFQEAILAVQRLGISYLWIDALCIIQDSEEDWAREAARMTDVYWNCYVNISADSSTDPQGGLFRQRDPLARKSFVIPNSRSDTGRCLYCCYIHEFTQDVERAPLKERAWVVQERLLSPRIVHFCATQVHWECAQLITSESLPAKLNIHRLTIFTYKKSSLWHRTLSKQRIDELYGLWAGVVVSYSRGKLSVPSDRSVAIAGLARAFFHLLNLQPADYVCGLFRPRFLQHLMWYAWKSQGRVDHATPSWSWLSIDGDARFSSYQTGSFYNWKATADVIEINVSPKGDMFGPVTSGYAKIKGPLFPALISNSSTPLRYNQQVPRKVINIGQQSLEEERFFFLKLDKTSVDSPKKVLGHTAYLLLCGGADMSSRCIDPKTSDSKVTRKWQVLNGLGHYECLILMPTDKPATFRRVGFVGFSGPTYKSWLETMGQLYEHDSPDVGQLLDEQFGAREIPQHLYEEVDDSSLYTITLV
ncbi:heterokaryon incompatibility protein-domain-containing protein [Xylariaceae sp. FL0662B]|nr:heterokaryon incompatibility protein-domain-containing protein [Xylariaceae sp. FL0662B]